ncbi:hypothetical protein [Streptomyces sp. MUM 178J]|uniref:hypothetical protein n=1 Tax=Streptomyces sp. MUM 178J TaxID=2791991 RepID=UPI001F03E123|nr:hypothetical protein [Streptomyces sp. MUM 178J]WRQ82923.1 hypothetical protein I3F59_028230 [Streptomyces sp. MUM 178J]
MSTAPAPDRRIEVTGAEAQWPLQDARTGRLMCPRREAPAVRPVAGAAERPSPAPTDPAPTDPAPTDPAPTDPAPTPAHRRKGESS